MAVGNLVHHTYLSTGYILAHATIPVCRVYHSVPVCRVHTSICKGKAIICREILHALGYTRAPPPWFGRLGRPQSLCCGVFIQRPISIISLPVCCKFVT